MRIAVISDIHGNDFAFDLVEADIQKQSVDKIVCLGDAIQGGAQPAEVVRRLRQLNCPVAMGNVDDWLLTKNGIEQENIPPERIKKMEAIRDWTLSKLSDDDKKFIAGFQPTITLPLENKLNLLCFHGSPVNYEDVIPPTISEEDFQKFLGGYENNILTGGHTHTQQIRRCGKNFFFNPGSVGIPYNRYQSKTHVDSWAEYAILTVQQGIFDVQFRRLPYDVQEIITIYRNSERPFAEDMIAQYQD